MSNQHASLTCTQLSFERVTRQGPRCILDNISFTMTTRDRVALVGSSGSGKSTMLHLLGGLLTPTQGRVEVTVQGVVVSPAQHPSCVQIIAQHPLIAPEFTIAENIALPALIAGTYTGVQRAHIDDLLTTIGLAGRGDEAPQHLSGGQRQLISCLRAVYVQPLFILADEPTAHLDPAARESVLTLLEQLAQRYGCGLLVATHDPVVAQRMQVCYRLEQHRLQREERV